MNKLSNEELIKINGGGITATMLNSLSRIIDTILNLGQVVGSSIRRVTSKKVCKIS